MSNGTAFGLTTQNRLVNLDGVIGTNDFLGGKGVNRAAGMRPQTGVRRTPNGLPMVPTPAQASLERQHLQQEQQNNMEKTSLFSGFKKLAFGKALGRLAGGAALSAAKPMFRDAALGAAGGHAADRAYSLVTGNDAPGLAWAGAAAGLGGKHLRRFMPQKMQSQVRGALNSGTMRAAAMPLIATGVIGNAQEMYGGVDYMSNPIKAGRQAKEKMLADTAQQLGFGSVQDMVQAAQRAGALAQSPMFRRMADRQINSSGSSLYMDPYYR